LEDVQKEKHFISFLCHTNYFFLSHDYEEEEFINTRKYNWNPLVKILPCNIYPQYFQELQKNKVDDESDGEQGVEEEEEGKEQEERGKKEDKLGPADFWWMVHFNFGGSKLCLFFVQHVSY